MKCFQAWFTGSIILGFCRHFMGMVFCSKISSFRHTWVRNIQGSIPVGFSVSSHGTMPQCPCRLCHMVLPSTLDLKQGLNLGYIFPLVFIFPSTLLVQSFAGTKFRGDKLSRTPRAKIKFRGYKLSRMKEILGLFSYFHAIICCLLIDISQMSSKVRFRGY